MEIDLQAEVAKLKAENATLKNKCALMQEQLLQNGIKFSEHDAMRNAYRKLEQIVSFVEYISHEKKV